MNNIEIKDLTYDQTIELENNLKVRGRADKIYKDFIRNVTFPMERYQGNGKFLVAAAELHSSHFQLVNNGNVDYWELIHVSRGGTTKIVITPRDIYNAIKKSENKDTSRDSYLMNSAVSSLEYYVEAVQRKEQDEYWLKRQQ